MAKCLFFCGQFIPNDIVEENYNVLKNTFSNASNVFYNALLNGFVSNGKNVYVAMFLPSSIYRKYKRYKSDLNVFVLKRFPFFLKFFYECFLTFFLVLLLKIKKKDLTVVFNVLRISQCIGGLLACKLFNVKSVAVVTDLPGYRINTIIQRNCIAKISDWIGRHLICYYDFYILLSKAMGEALKLCEKRYVVVEGMYDLNDENSQSKRKRDVFTIMYAGSLEYKYGIMQLIAAVKELDFPLYLDIYGTGGAENEINKISKLNEKIRFWGSTSHNIILEKEKEVSLLVNPRPVDEEYAKYSFPSKNLEYMASGTPVLLTKIPSLPKDYYSYVYLSDDGSVENIKQGIVRAYKDYCCADFSMATAAKDFILKNKNSTVQVKKIIDSLHI